ncbi:MAG: pseudaminic acid cytidylyltransferase [Clostridium sp.]|nr:pseudaminic acid cytidylyltransferase [Clostridium sp.]
MKKRTIAIIPARGGSKRIPKKNIKKFCGNPIILYSIKAAIESGIFDEVMVSTDSKEIASIAREYGANVPFYRSEELSGDYASTAQVVMEVLQKYKDNKEIYDYAVCIYPTAPFLTPEIICKAQNIMEQYNPDEVIGVVEFSYPPQRCYSITNDGLMEYKYKEFVDIRSQDLEKLYHDAGQIYIYNVESLIRKNGKIVSGIMPMVLSPLTVQDIDTEDDWKLAEMKYKFWKEKKYDS